jgi:hypothetical protein
MDKKLTEEDIKLDPVLARMINPVLEKSIDSKI